MKWAWKLGRLAGIDVYVHATFLLIVAFVAVSHWVRGLGVPGVIEGVAFVLAIFACVVLHEYGHALAARRYGIRTRDITLYPIGGVARLERMPERPLQEMAVALAGPAVNVGIAALLFVWLVGSHTLRPFGELGVATGPFLERLLMANLFLVAFNLVPAFPMDGGRVLRALLALRLSYARATEIAAGVGQAMALLFGLLGLFGNPMLLLIALFVWIGAAQEAGMVQMRSALAGIPVRRAMLTDFRTLHPSDPLSRAVDLLLSTAQQEFPVAARGVVQGVLTRADLVQALARHPQSTPVEVVMRREVAQATPDEMLETALARLQEPSCPVLPITHGGVLVGMVTSESIAELVMIRTATGGRATA